MKNFLVVDTGSAATATLRLLFADCEVLRIEPVGDGVRIRLSAAHVLQSTQAAGDRPEEGYARGVVIELIGATLNESAGDFIGRISQGRVLLAEHWTPAVPLPCAFAGPAELEFSFANQSHLVAVASGIEFRFEGEPNFAESLFC